MRVSDLAKHILVGVNALIDRAGYKFGSQGAKLCPCQITLQRVSCDVVLRCLETVGVAEEKDRLKGFKMMVVIYYNSSRPNLGTPFQ